MAIEKKTLETRIKDVVIRIAEEFIKAYFPTAKVTKKDGVALIEITDKYGYTSAQVLDGINATVTSIASNLTDGLMSKEMAAKLEGIEAGAQVNTITGIKGSAESKYRTGNVEISPENLGLGKLDNTSDAEKNVLSASKLTNAVTIGLSGAVTGTPTEFDGSENITIPVTGIDVSRASAGILGIAYGGTGRTDGKSAGLTSAQVLKVKLDYTGNATFDGTAAQKSIGVSGVLAVANGGTGASTAEEVCAGKDVNGDPIVDTYATKAELAAQGSAAASKYATKAEAVTSITGSGTTLTVTYADGDTNTFTTQDTTYGAATESKAGLMSAADKTKLDAIAAGADDVSFTANLTAGTKIGTLTINGVENTLYCQTNTDSKVTQNASSTDNTYPILLSSTANAAENQGAKPSIFAPAVKVNPATGELIATKFTGTLFGNATSATKATQDSDGKQINKTYAKLASPALTGTPTAPTAAVGTNTTQIATTAYVVAQINESLTSAQAITYQGTLGTGADFTALPDTHTCGWLFYVNTAGTYAGQVCEVGDFVVCKKSGTSANNADWSVWQKNINGAVTGPANAVDSRIAVFSGTSGKIIKDSGFTIGKSVPADAKFTDTTYNVVTSSANGLMSSAMLSKLNGIQASATNVSFTQGLTTGTLVGTITINGTPTNIYCQTNTNTDTLVAQDVSSANNTYPLLMSPTANATENQGAKRSIFSAAIKANPSTGEIVANKFTGSFAGKATSAGTADKCTGNAATATKFASSQTIAITGDITGSASSQAGWSIAATLADSGVAAGSYGPAANATPGYGSTFSVPYITVDAKGRVTSIVSRTVKIPASDNTDTHWTTKAIVGASDGTANSATDNGNTYLRIFDNNTARANFKIVGTGATKVTSDANGVITINSTDTNSDTHWTSHLYAGVSNGNTNAETTNGNTYLILCDNSSARDRRLIKGTGATTVTSDANGVISIYSKNTTYTFTNSAATLEWGKAKTIANVGGTDITVALPANPNTDTHWTTTLFAGAKDAKSNAATENGSAYIKLFDENTVRSQLCIKGTGATTVTTDANGVITINSSDTNTVYKHPAYTARTGVPTTDATPSFGGTFSVSQPVSDATGHITNINSRSIKIPNTAASATATGLVTTSNQTFAGNKTFNGNIVLNKSSLQATAKYTDAETTYTSDIIRVNSDNSGYGLNVALCGAGNTVVGAGESGYSQLTDLAGNNGEDLYLVADGKIYFKPNGSTWANAKTVTLDASANLSGINNLTATTITGKIQATPSQSTWVGGVTAGGALVNATHTNYGAVWNAPTKSYRVGCATYPSNNEDVYLCYSVSNENISNGTNTLAKKLIWNADTGALSANSFVGNISGNASTATNATNDSDGNKISTTYSKTNHTHSTFTGASASAAGAVGFVPAPAKGDQTKFLRADGTWVVPTNTTYTFTNKGATLAWSTTSTIATVGGVDIKVTMPANPNTNTWTAFKGASASAAGTAGYVPAPAAGDQNKFFRADGTWVVPTNTTYSFTNKAATLAWSTTSTIATVGGVDITVKMPANPNTNTWTAFKGATSSAAGTAGYVPAPAKGEQNKYFRADGTWQTPPDTNTTYTAASAAPLVAGTAAVGTSAKYAREDHVHPAQTSVSGNAGTATKLATARNIWGQSFNGTGDISGVFTGTANIYIKNTALVKGTNPSDFKCRDFRFVDNSGSDGDAPLTGMIRNSVATNGTVETHLYAYKYVKDDTTNAKIGVGIKTDGTVYTYAPTPATADNSTKIATTAFVKAQKYLTSHQSLANYLTKLTNVSEMGRYINLHFDNGTAKYDYDVRMQVNSQGTAAGGGVLQIVANSVKASKFEGALVGNADTATKATNDSDGNKISTTYSKTNHTHSYLPLSGGTVTGSLILSRTQDEGGTSANVPALVVGGTFAQAHMEFDANEIICKGAATTANNTTTYAPTTLYLNHDGGGVVIGKSGGEDVTINGIDIKVFSGATSSAAGTAGLIPAPAKGDQAKFLRADGTWQVPTDTNNATAQNISTANNTYPILFGATANATANIGNRATYFCSNVKVNPSTATITATTFAGKIQAAPSKDTFVGAVTLGGALVNSTHTSYGGIWNAPTKDYRVGCSTYPSSNNEVYVCYSVTNANVTAGTNTVTKKLVWNADTGALTADSFNGNASNVSGTVAIAHGGTGATTRLAAIKNLTNENISTNATHFLGLKSDWSKVGYFTLAEAKTLLGINATNKGATLAWSTTSTVATVNGVDIKVTMPANPHSSTASLVRGANLANKKYVDIVQVSASDKSTDGTANRVSTIRMTNGDGVNEILLGVHNESNGAPNGLVIKNTNGDFTAFFPGKFTLDNSNLYIKNHNVTKGTNPSSFTCKDIRFIDKSDKTGDAPLTGMIRNAIGSDGTVTTSFYAYKYAADATNNAGISVSYKTDGSYYTAAPTPGDNDNTTKIATTAWVQKFCGTTKKYSTTDNKVSQTVLVSSGAYPLLASSVNNGTATTTNTSIFAAGVTLDPKTKSITANTFFSAVVDLGTGTAIKVSDGAVFKKTISANTTFTITGTPSGKAATFSLCLTGGENKVITWPSSVKWTNNQKPTISSGVDVFTFVTYDGGSTWFATVSVYNS